MREKVEGEEGNKLVRGREALSLSLLQNIFHFHSVIPFLSPFFLSISIRTVIIMMRERERERVSFSRFEEKIPLNFFRYEKKKQQVEVGGKKRVSERERESERER